jgi:hypothetical protein
VTQLEAATGTAAVTVDVPVKDSRGTQAQALGCGMAGNSLLDAKICATINPPRGNTIIFKSFLAQNITSAPAIFRQF